MGFFENVRRAWANILALDDLMGSELRGRVEHTAKQRDYYEGRHTRQIKPSKGVDDNLVLNFSRLIVDRGISMLLGQGIEFDLPGEPIEMEEEQPDGTTKSTKVDPPNQKWIDAVWAANKKDILLHKVAQFGGQHGTCYLKIEPEGIEGRDGTLYPRLIALDPLYLSIETHQEDIDWVLRYIIRYNILDERGNKVARKEEISQEYGTVDEMGEPTTEAEQIVGFAQKGWVIRNYKSDAQGRWELLSEELWAYPFPPIQHWQNLPKAGSVYGEPDLSDDVMEVQDRINFVVSNISKIIRYHAHPKTWARGTNLGNEATWGADKLITVQGENGMIANLEMQSDLASSTGFAQMLRQALFDISRTVDLASMQDKLGALTNFALQVLFFDALAKLGTKQELYGEALMELNSRLLKMEGMAPDPGTVVWPEVLPVSDTDQVQSLSSDMDNGLLSKQTAAGIRGYDWEQEQQRINQEKESQGSIGEMLLKVFETGQEPGLE